MTSTYDATARVLELLDQAPAEALKTATEIRNPAARVYALSWVARYATNSIARDALREARSAVRECGDDYGRSVALAWPIRAALERGEVRIARQMLADALAVLPALATVSERAEILSQLFDASLPGGAEFWSPLARQLIDLCPADVQWRAARAHLRAVGSLKEKDRALAQALVAAMKPGKVERRARRLLESGQPCVERVFFSDRRDDTRAPD
jgi:hypothetical protein